MTSYIQVTTTAGSESDARAIGRALVERRLAACAQVVGPIASTYWWQGQIETAEEWLCLLKSSQDLFDSLEQAIRELHPYQVPEIIATAVTAGSADYLAWMKENLG